MPWYKRDPLVDSWSSLISERIPDARAFATLTYSDASAQRLQVYSTASAQRDFRNFLRACGYSGAFFASVESHRHRSVPHLHAIMQVPNEGIRKALWGEWFRTRGRVQIQPATNAEDVRLYVAKYVLKDDDGTATFWRC